MGDPPPSHTPTLHTKYLGRKCFNSAQIQIFNFTQVPEITSASAAPFTRAPRCATLGLMSPKSSDSFAVSLNWRLGYPKRLLVNFLCAIGYAEKIPLSVEIYKVGTVVYQFWYFRGLAGVYARYFIPIDSSDFKVLKPSELTVKNASTEAH